MSPEQNASRIKMEKAKRRAEAEKEEGRAAREKVNQERPLENLSDSEDDEGKAGDKPSSAESIIEPVALDRPKTPISNKQAKKAKAADAKSTKHQH